MFSKINFETRKKRNLKFSNFIHLELCFVTNWSRKCLNLNDWNLKQTQKVDRRMTSTTQFTFHFCSFSMVIVWFIIIKHLIQLYTITKPLNFHFLWQKRESLCTLFIPKTLLIHFECHFCTNVNYVCRWELYIFF